MQKTTKIISYFTDTYELGPDDLDWGLGYPVAEYDEPDHGIPLSYAIEENLLWKVQELHPDTDITCIKNEWNDDGSKLTIIFEIRESK